MKKRAIQLRRESVRLLSTGEIEKASGGAPTTGTIGGTTTIVTTFTETSFVSRLHLCGPQWPPPSP